MARATSRNRSLARSLTHLSARLDQHLLGYATAATAAGVGALALAQPAEAKIVYTPSDIPITANGPAVQIDLNHDGVPDFSFYNFVQSGDARVGARPPEGTYGHFFWVQPAQPGNAIGAITSFTGAACAAELDPDRQVGPGKNFQSAVLPMSSIFGTYGNPGTLHCPWRGNKGGFLGLKFVVNGETFYGWAHVTLGGPPTVTGYAFENVPNTAIQTGATKGAQKTDASGPTVPSVPQPASLGMLALGAPGLAIWRRPEEMN
jgi:hypothetical protein